MAPLELLAADKGGVKSKEKDKERKKLERERLLSDDSYMCLTFSAAHGSCSHSVDPVIGSVAVDTIVSSRKLSSNKLTEIGGSGDPLRLKDKHARGEYETSEKEMKIRIIHVNIIQYTNM